MDIAQEILTKFNDDSDLFKKFITGDESWVYGYDIEAKLKQREEPNSKKERQVWSNVKVLLTVFFDCNGMVHQELLFKGRTVNNESNLVVMRQLS